MGTQIHWFPGHMKKALNEMSERIKIMDVVVELLDSRAPLASINENLEKVISNKKRLVVLTKPDLADPVKTDKVKELLSKTYDKILVLDLTNPKSQKIIVDAIKELGKEKQARDMAKGMKPQPIKTMIIGIPNVGKSSLINRFSNRKAAGVQNKPGYTRGEQWIKVNNDFVLCDTPGILPMNYENKEKAIRLALIGSIREEILPNNDLADYLLNYLKVNYKDALKARFDIDTIQEDNQVTYQAIASRRGLLDYQGGYDLDKAYGVLLKEFKDGKLGRITLENY